MSYPEQETVFARRARWTILVLVVAAIVLWATGVFAHDWYTGLQNKAGEYCCNKHDFKPVRAWVDPTDGLWHAMYPTKDGEVEYAIPPEIILPDDKNKEPFQAHLAVVYGKPRCFLRKAAGG